MCIRDSKAEEPEKVLVASASIHGHTRAAAHTLADKLRAKAEPYHSEPDPQLIYAPIILTI